MKNLLPVSDTRKVSLYPARKMLHFVQNDRCRESRIITNIGRESSRGNGEIQVKNRNYVNKIVLDIMIEGCYIYGKLRGS